MIHIMFMVLAMFCATLLLLVGLSKRMDSVSSEGIGLTIALAIVAAVAKYIGW
jgi:hypothetical protein